MLTFVTFCTRRPTKIRKFLYNSDLVAKLGVSEYNFINFFIELVLLLSRCWPTEITIDVINQQQERQKLDVKSSFI